MRIALATKIIVTTNFHADFRQAFYDVDIWAVLISLAFQDIPFLAIRLYILGWLWTVDFAQLLFAGKNVLIILLQSYRFSVLLNDRYLNPPLGARARTMIDERRQSMAPGSLLRSGEGGGSKMSVFELTGGGGNNSGNGTRIGGGGAHTLQR